MTTEYFKINHLFSKERTFCNSGQAELYHPDSGYGFVTAANRAEFPILKIPEINGGFIPKWWYGDKELTEIQVTKHGCTWKTSAEVLEGDIVNRSLPLCYKQNVPSMGSYRLTLTLWADDDAEDVLVFTGRRRLAWRGDILTNQTVTVTALCDVSPIIPRGQKEPITDLSVSFVLLCGKGKVFLQSMKVEKVSAHTVYIMGDSTVTDQTGDVPYAPGTSFGGWGQMLSVFLPDGYCVSNHAHSGLTTESFRSEGHWAVMAPLVKPGDICLLQFGHNDQKLAFLQADGGYKSRLEQYISELRAMGAKPVLVTPLARNSWKNPEEYNDLLAEYAKVVFQIGRRLDVPVLDLHGYAMEQIQAAGLDGAKPLFFPSDYTHTNDYGAYKMAAFIGEELCKVLNIPPVFLADWPPNEPLTPLTPPSDCTFSPNNRASDALAVFASERPKEPITRIEALELIIQKMRFFPINVYNDLYEDVLGHETYAGTVQCAAQNGMIPPALVADGKLHPDRPMSLQEFLAVLMPAYASRKKLKRSAHTPMGVSEYAKEAVSLALGEHLIEKNAIWEALLSRGQAAAICGSVKI